MSEVSKRPDLEVLLSRLRGLPALPAVASQVMRLADDPKSSARDFERVLSQDAALAGKILRTANSAYYWGSRGQISSISRAIMVLGLNTVRSITISLSFQGMFAARPGSGFDRHRFWRHSLAVALGAKILARIRKHPKSEEAFTAGLMHDIGKVVADMFLTAEFAEAIRKAHIAHKPLDMVEQATMGLNHMEIGRIAAEKWQLPDLIRNAIAFHHTPSGDQDTYPITAFVHVGDHLAHQFGLSCIEGEIPTPIDEAAMESLQIPPAQFKPIGQVLWKEVEEAAAAFGI